MNPRGVLTAFVYLFAMRSLLANAPDHLVPPYEDRDWGVSDYAALLENKLFLTPATYGRVLVRPSAGSIGESSLSLHPSSHEGTVSVTYVRASRNVWYYLSYPPSPASRHSAHEAWEDAPLRFSRSDATLPASAGAALRAALAAMLRGTRGRYPGTTRVIVDGYDIQFSLVESGKTMRGVITAGLTGKNVSELEKVVDLLESFCQAPSARQASLATQIERKAKQIVARTNKT